MIQTQGGGALKGVDFGGTSAPKPTGWFESLATGFDFVVLDCMDPSYDADLAAALKAGLAVMTFQGYWAPAWNQSPATRAGSAVYYALKADYEKGAIIWLDWESVTLSAAASAHWIDAWAKAIAAGGYVPGLWVGEPQPLTSEQLWLLPNIQHYGRTSSASVPTVANRGYQLIQTAEGDSYDGQPVDMDTLVPDQKGGVAPYMRNAAPSAILPPPPVTLTISAPGFVSETVTLKHGA